VDVFFFFGGGGGGGGISLSLLYQILISMAMGAPKDGAKFFLYTIL